MLVQEKHSTDAAVQVCPAILSDEKEMQRLRWIEKRSITLNRSELSNTFFSLNERGWDISGHPLVRDADVVNLHWVADFQSPRSIRQLLSLGKPVVWTLHDQRPFTGGCHFTAGCSRFETECFPCPQLQVDKDGLPRAQLDDADFFLAETSLTLVCPSQWMANAASRSHAFSGLRRQVIPYSVDTALFRPQSKPELRKMLGVPADATCLLFGADNANEKRKGFRYLIEALEHCCRDSDFDAQVGAKNIVLICLGHPHARISELGMPVINTGYITDDERISQWYAAADMFVLPSLEDNLPNTVLEAMSTGLPVVAFASGGIPEAIRENQTGKLAPARDSKALAEAIIALVANPKLRATIGTNARAMALQEHGLVVQAKRYAELYRSLGPPRTYAAPAFGEVSLAPLGGHFAEVYYGLLLAAMRQRHEHGDDSLPYRRRKFGRQKLVLAWHYLRLYNWVLNRVRRSARKGRE